MSSLLRIIFLFDLILCLTLDKIIIKFLFCIFEALLKLLSSSPVTVVIIVVKALQI